MAIVDGDDRLGTVSLPIAWDAQGRPVPVSAEIEGDDLVIRVEHQGRDLAYPVVIDPYTFEDQSFSQGSDYTGWVYAGQRPNFIAGFQGNAGAGNGLNLFNYASSNPYNAGEIGQWQYQAPTTPGFVDEGAFVYKADFGSVVHRLQDVGGCAVEGIWRTTAGRWEVPQYFRGPRNGIDPVRSGPSVDCGLENYNYDVLGLNNPLPDDGGPIPPADRAGPGNAAIFQYYVRTTGARSVSRTLYTGRTLLHLSDRGLPRISAATPEGWVDDATFEASAVDYGLGMRKIGLNVPGWSGNRPPLVSSCPRNNQRTAPCPQRIADTFSTATMPEGTTVATISAEDAIEQPRAASRTLKIDHEPPEITASGNLWDARSGRIGPDRDYTLSVRAIDGDPSSAGAQRSGAVAVTATIGDRPLTGSSETAACTRPEGSCGLTLDALLTAEQLDDLPDGEHTVRMTATDALGHTTPVQSFTVTYDSTLSIAEGAEPAAPADPAFAGPPGCSSSPPAPTVVDTPASAAQDADQAVQTIRDVLPAAVAASIQAPTTNLRPALGLVGGDAVSRGSLTDLRVATRFAGGFALGRGIGGVCFFPTRVSDEARPGTLVDQAAMVFASSDQATSTVVRPTATGAETLTVLNDASAPRSFSWRVDAGPGRRLVTMDDGSLAVVNPAPGPISDPDDARIADDASVALVNVGSDELEAEAPLPRTVTELAAAVGITAQGLERAHDDFARAQNDTLDEVLLVIPKPWAIDADDQPVPATLTTDGTNVTLTLDPAADATFPIVADPTPAASASSRGGPLRVMTFNTRSGRPNSSAQDPSPDESDHRAHARRVAATIYQQLVARSLQDRTPAIVGLQEMCLFDLQLIEQLLDNGEFRRTGDPDMDWHADFRRHATAPASCPTPAGQRPNGDPRGPEFGNAIIRNVRRTGGDSQRYGAQFQERRGYMRQQIDVRGRDVQFLTTHLVPSDSPNMTVRIAQSRQLRGRAQGFENPVAAVGDFNDDPPNPPVREWRENGWIDADRCQRRDPRDRECEEPTAGPRRFDYIFTRRMSINRTNVAGIGDPTSDHRPVVASTAPR